jgi:uncharacterized membrane protein YtjA (UPF0391 family)
MRPQDRHGEGTGWPWVFGTASLGLTARHSVCSKICTAKVRPLLYLASLEVLALRVQRIYMPTPPAIRWRGLKLSRLNSSLACDRSAAITRECVTGDAGNENSFAGFSCRLDTVNAEDLFMFGWALTFLIVALIAGVLGFGGVAVISIEMAKLIFTVAIILFLISVIIGFLRGRSAPMP